jgi:predicted Rossmann fold nucleotide-binding protein DprA/Smf involved in DNA uptake
MKTLTLEETLEFKQLFDQRATVQTQIQKKTLEFEAETKDLREKLAEIDKQLGKLGLNLADSDGRNASAGPKRVKSRELIQTSLQEAGKKGSSVPEIAEKTGIKPQNVSSWLYFNRNKHPNIKKDGKRYYWTERKKSK